MWEVSLGAEVTYNAFKASSGTKTLHNSSLYTQTRFDNLSHYDGNHFIFHRIYWEVNDNKTWVRRIWISQCSTLREDVVLNLGLSNDSFFLIAINRILSP